MYRLIATGDFLIFAVLAIPGLGSLVVGWLAELNRTLGLGGNYQGTPATTLGLMPTTTYISRIKQGENRVFR